MKARIIISLLVVILMCSWIGISFADKPNEFVVGLIIDKTASMEGHGDGNGEDIWNDVQKYLMEFIDNLHQNTMVVVFEFHATVSDPKEFMVNTTDDKNKIRDYVKNIIPNGQRTAIYDALEKSISHLKNRYPTNNKLLYLITDGRDNISHISFSQVLKTFSTKQGEYDHIYYIDLRDKAPIDIRKQIEDNPDISISKGFAKTVTLVPMFEKIPITYGKTSSFEQRFIAYGADAPADFEYSLSHSMQYAGINIDIVPSTNVKMQMLEKGKYSSMFTVEYLTGTLSQQTEVLITLNSVKKNDIIINFQPREFRLELVNKKRPKVESPSGGWK